MPVLRTRDTQSRSLEVTTDTPPPPALAIISPTPRAFTFPSSHNLSDSPYSTPSSSPFEPDLRSLALSSSCTTPPPLMRTLTPDSAYSVSTSSSSPSHKRRKSSSASIDVERRPKKGDEDYIKRPENAFILFRRKCCEERQQAQEESASDTVTKKQRQADLSKAISQQWKSLPAEERKYWEDLAKEKKKEHEQLYPNYVYRPQRVRDKDGKARNKKHKPRKGEVEEETNKSISFIIPPTAPRLHGRSASAPNSTPDVVSNHPGSDSIPYNTFLPNVSLTATDDLSPFRLRRQPGGCHGQLRLPTQPTLDASNVRIRPTRATVFRSNAVNPLTMPHESTMLLPAHSIISPASSIASGSSGPSSPAAGPFTPTSNMLPHPAFSQLGQQCIPPDTCSPEMHQEQEFMPMEMQGDIGYSSYSWDNSSMWHGESAMLASGDFDINSIPPIELGFPSTTLKKSSLQRPSSTTSIRKSHISTMRPSTPTSTARSIASRSTPRAKV
ncbi:slightly ste11-like protein [Paramarasmius palmivorus]|uniref:Slightly ste11-like protein n=1 Tax=Paramarasmius palmivorus TaxID=297713 RepID=A0AAW0BLM1_9AGAR